MNWTCVGIVTSLWILGGALFVQVCSPDRLVGGILLYAGTSALVGTLCLLVHNISNKAFAREWAVRIAR